MSLERRKSELAWFVDGGRVRGGGVTDFDPVGFCQRPERRVSGAVHGEGHHILPVDILGPEDLAVHHDSDRMDGNSGRAVRGLRRHRHDQKKNNDQNPCEEICSFAFHQYDLHFRLICGLSFCAQLIPDVGQRQM